MLLLLVAFLGGVLTVLSPCILPVLPFVFPRTGQSSLEASVPLLAGMAIAFASVASLGAVAAAWAVHLNQAGRWMGLAVLALFAGSLLFPGIAAACTRPLVRAGERLAGVRTPRPWLTSALLGVAAGLIWSPCAGPILGVILSSAALSGPTAHTSLLLVAYGLGGGIALWTVLQTGKRALPGVHAWFLTSQWGRRATGTAMLAGVVCIATGVDASVLARVRAPGAATLEASVLQRAQADALPVESTQVSLEGGTKWLNAQPQSIAALRGKVVLVNFWTYSCVNCLRTLPYVKAWGQKYADRGLVVVGVHAPEFAFEKDEANVRKAIRDLGIAYPVVQDNQFRIWRAFDNQYWPALYFVDVRGRIRHHQFGEGDYAASERVIEELLREAGTAPGDNARAATPVDTSGVGMAADAATLRSGETYLGYEKASGLRVAGRAVPDEPAQYERAPLRPNTWTLAGNWTLRAERIEANTPGNVLAMRFEARDVNAVLGAAPGKPVRIRVTLDGQAPGANHGSDVDAQGNGVVDANRLYQMVRQTGTVKARTVEIQFLDGGALGYAFTFG